MNLNALWGLGRRPPSNRPFIFLIRGSPAELNLRKRTEDTRQLNPVIMLANEPSSTAGRSLLFVGVSHMSLWLSLSVNCRDRHAPTISADVRSHFHRLSESPFEEVLKSSLEISTARISVGVKNLFKQALRKLE